MGRARSYRELRVYQEAFALAMEVFELASGFPDHEQYDLARQAKRSSRSVCANTAEAWRRRRYPAALVAKIVDAEAEASETRVHIEFAHTAMRTRPEKWGPRQRTRAGAPAKVESSRHRSAVAPPTPHAQAPNKKVDSSRRRSASANPPQAGPTEPPARPESSRHHEPPSTIADGSEGPAP